MKNIHVFNTSVVSGPEMLVVPALKNVVGTKEIWCLEEARAGSGVELMRDFCAGEGIRVLPITVQKRLDMAAVLGMAKEMRSFSGPILIHSHDVKASFYVWLAKLISSNSQIRLFATHHGAMVRPDILSRLYENIFVMITSLFFRYLFCVSISDYNLLRSRGVPKRVLRLHRNGVDRPALNWEQRRVFEVDVTLCFVIIARLSAEKNHERALRVLGAFGKIFKGPWTVDLLGEGAEKDRIVALVKQLELSRHVRLRGYIHEAWRELDRYHCLLSFSLGEGLPVSMIEAGWRTTPVFASAVGGVPEVCGKDGAVLFDLSDSDDEIASRLAAFVGSQWNLRRRAEALHQRVRESFSETSWRGRLLELYRSALGDDE